MKDKRVRKRWIFVFCGLLLLVLAAVFAVYLPYKNKAKAPVTVNNTGSSSEGGVVPGASQGGQFDQKDNVTTPGDNPPAPDTTVPPNPGTAYDPNNSADSYYYLALKNTTEKNYTEAISNFSKAIALDPKQEDYYSKKAEAEVLNGNKNGAIATVEAGLVALPGNELLQNKLDIIKATVK